MGGRPAEVIAVIPPRFSASLKLNEGKMLRFLAIPQETS